MQKYAKILDEATGSVQVGMGTNSQFYESIGMELMEIEQAYNGQWYAAGYAPDEPTPTLEELSAQLRTERDRRITACDWIISRHAEEVAMGLDTTLADFQYSEWLSYRQDLRDLTDADGFPWDGGGEQTPWPVAPEM